MPLPFRVLLIHSHLVVLVYMDDLSISGMEAALRIVALHIARNSNFYEQTKHIEDKYHFVRD
ncbi:hypothetical protein CR513_50638, partial [Mucuna pruriens]